MSKYVDELKFEIGDLVYVSCTHSTRIYRIVDIKDATTGKGWRVTAHKYALCEPADGKPFRKKQSDVKVDWIFPEKKSNQNVYLITQLTTIKVLEEQIRDTQKRLDFLLKLQQTIEGL